MIATCPGCTAHLPSKPERAGVLGAQPQARVVADLQVRPVDRLESAGAGRHEQRLLRVEPALRRQDAGGAAQRRREVGVTEDQRLEPGRAGADLADVQQSGRGLDERLQAALRRRARPARRAGARPR